MEQILAQLAVEAIRFADAERQRNAAATPEQIAAIWLRSRDNSRDAEALWQAAQDMRKG